MNFVIVGSIGRGSIGSLVLERQSSAPINYFFSGGSEGAMPVQDIVLSYR